MDFPKKSIRFSNEYGFATLALNFEDADRIERLRKKNTDKLNRLLEEYRVFWNESYRNAPSRICLYVEQGRIFKDIDEEVAYCANGLNILIKHK